MSCLLGSLTSGVSYHAKVILAKSVYGKCVILLQVVCCTQEGVFQEGRPLKDSSGSSLMTLDYIWEAVAHPAYF